MTPGMYLAFAAGLWIGDIIWFKIKPDGHDFKYYFWRGALKALIFLILISIYEFIKSAVV